MDNTWRLNVRMGWILGLALAVVFIGITVGLIVAAVVSSLSIWVFLMGLGACLSLGLTIRVLYQLWGLINASYELDRNALVIRWGPVQHQIPMGAVQEVLSGAKLEKVRIRPSLRWPGYSVGVGKGWVASSGDDEAEKRVDPIVFYASAPRKRQVIVRTTGVAYAISPADLSEFLEALRERLAMGPTQEVEERSTHPGFLDWPIWQDRASLLMLGGSTLLLVLLVGLLCWRFPYLPAEIALRFTSSGTPLLVGSPARIFYFALLGAAFLVINGGLGLFFYRRERPISYFLWSGLVATLSSLWAAVISILLMQ
ncbi:MAG: hypothetical protein JXC32_19110 [Anaerolineae bacterium]|nr:hypothetical protein [Anaerolineae bacterium]